MISADAAAAAACVDPRPRRRDGDDDDDDCYDARRRPRRPTDPAASATASDRRLGGCRGRSSLGLCGGGDLGAAAAGLAAQLSRPAEGGHSLSSTETPVANKCLIVSY